MDNKLSVDSTGLNELDIEKTVEKVYEALLSDNDIDYEPAIQFAGYILSEDPLYMPCGGNARGLISHIDRDELLILMIEYYLEHRFAGKKEAILAKRKDKK